MADPRQPPVAPVEHFNEKEHRRLLANRANAALAPVLSSLTAGQRLMWDGEAWVNDGESGTWTPTLTTTDVDFDAVSYGSLNGGRYVRIGDLVFIAGRLVTASVTKGLAAGNVRIGGIPFPAISTPTTFSLDSLAVSLVTAWTTTHPSAAILVEGTSTIAVHGRSAADGATSPLTVANVDTGSNKNQIRFSGWYTTS